MGTHKNRDTYHFPNPQIQEFRDCEFEKVIYEFGIEG
jgi:hypothetical protein